MWLSPAALAFFNVFTVRSEESETGIQVFDASGNPVGISKAAGEKVEEEPTENKTSIYISSLHYNDSTINRSAD